MAGPVPLAACPVVPWVALRRLPRLQAPYSGALCPLTLEPPAPAADFLVLFVGSHADHKGTERLLRAFAATWTLGSAVPGSGERLLLVMVGPRVTKLEPVLKELSKGTPGLGKAVHLLNAASDDASRLGWYAAGDVQVINSGAPPASALAQAHGSTWQGGGEEEARLAAQLWLGPCGGRPGSAPPGPEAHPGVAMPQFARTLGECCSRAWPCRCHCWPPAAEAARTSWLTRRRVCCTLRPTRKLSQAS